MTRPNVDRMRRRAQLVQDAEAERAAAAAAAAVWASPVGRYVAGIAEALTRSMFPNGPYAFRFDAQPEERP